MYFYSCLFNFCQFITMHLEVFLGPRKFSVLFWIWTLFLYRVRSFHLLSSLFKSFLSSFLYSTFWTPNIKKNTSNTTLLFMPTIVECKKRKVQKLNTGHFLDLPLKIFMQEVRSMEKLERAMEQQFWIGKRLHQMYVSPAALLLYASISAKFWEVTQLKSRFQKISITSGRYSDGAEVLRHN